MYASINKRPHYFIFAAISLCKYRYLDNPSIFDCICHKETLLKVDSFEALQSMFTNGI